MSKGQYSLAPAFVFACACACACDLIFLEFIKSSNYKQKIPGLKPGFYGPYFRALKVG
jgi:hypothetical protein